MTGLDPPQLDEHTFSKSVARATAAQSSSSARMRMAAARWARAPCLIYQRAAAGIASPLRSHKCVTLSAKSIFLHLHLFFCLQ